MRLNDTHENQINEARDLLAGLGWPYWVLAQRQRLKGSAGLPDVFFVGSASLDAYAEQTLDHIARLRDSGAVRATVPCWWETKANTDTEKPAQKQFKRLVQAAGNPVLTGRVDVISDFFKLDRRRP